MKKEAKAVRNKMIVVRVNDDEDTKLQELFKRSTDNSLSHYLRKTILQKPVTIKYRNQTADDFLKQMLELKKELHFIGNNFNQAVRKLHTLEKIPEFRSWILTYQTICDALLQKIEMIEKKINQLYEEWLQK